LLSSRRIFGLLVLLCSTRLAYPQSRPDFSGTWRQNNERTVPRPKDDSYSYRAIVDQHDSVLDVVVSVVGGREQGELHLNYSIGGGELVYIGLDHDEFHTTVRWRGQELVFDTVEYERGEKVLVTETWSLLEGGHTLKRVKEENGPDKHSTRIYILEKTVMKAVGKTWRQLRRSERISVRVQENSMTAERPNFVLAAPQPEGVEVAHASRLYDSEIRLQEEAYEH
jgi:hypothetical protein